jgi:hypothetical protein
MKIQYMHIGIYVHIFFGIVSNNTPPPPPNTNAIILLWMRYWPKSSVLTNATTGGTDRAVWQARNALFKIHIKEMPVLEFLNNL